MQYLAQLQSAFDETLLQHFSPALRERLCQNDAGTVDACAEAVAILHRELTSLVGLIPAPLVREQLANPEPGRVCGAYWNGSVLFADLSGFTALSEQLSKLGKKGAEEISAIINLLFAALVKEVHNFGGAPLKFGGDALTAFFDAESLGDEHALFACAAALAMQERMTSFTAVATPVGEASLQLRVGVHSGPVFAAQVGDLSHIELVVSGQTINEVAQAQEVAEPGEVAISATTLALLQAYPEQTTSERAEQFSILHSLPTVEPFKPTASLIPELPAQPGIDTLILLGRQVDALRPYLMHGLPMRHIDAEEAPRLGEFRPVSILFANFSSFSAILDALGEQTDLAARVLNAYYRRAQTLIHAYGGVVNKVDMYTSGDKLMALFGAPVAHEDDPSRAVRCALELTKALDAANQEIAALLREAPWQVVKANHASLSSLSQKIGINTGTVFAGRVGPLERHEYTVMGPAVNLAARLMSKAEEGTVILSPSTRRAVQREIDVKELAPVRLKGLAEPVTPVQALQPRRDTARAETQREGSLRYPAFVAREEELAACLAQSRAALNESGRVLALVGVAGIGKTRMTQELVRRLTLAAIESNEVRSFAIYFSDCQSYEQSTPYAAVRRLLQDLLDINSREARTANELAEQVAQRVQRFAPDLVRFAPLLGDMLGTPLPDTSLTAQLSPEQRHDRAHDLFEGLLRGRMGDDGMLLLIDDFHWADPSSLELLVRLARSAHNLRLLLAFSYRPDQDFAEPWLDMPNAQRVELGELSPEASALFVQALLAGPPPAELSPLIDRTQGNPFFIEEMFRHLLATQTLLYSNDGTWKLARPLDSMYLPDSIEGVLTAQLDRLVERSRELVQVAAVIGRRFLYTVLNGIYSQRASLDTGLRQLTASDIILAEELERELAYLFRHSLVRDVAYESILYARRRELHQRVAERIISLYGKDAPDQMALLAQHYLLAEDWVQAFEYHWVAGCAAQQRYANREALNLFTQALMIAPHLTPRQHEREVAILERSGTINFLIGDHDWALSSFNIALDICMMLPTAASEQIVRLHRFIAATHERRSDFDAAFDWLDRGLGCADVMAQSEVARCHLLRAGILQRQGNYQECLEWAELGKGIANLLNSPDDEAKAYKLLGGTYRLLGDTSRAIELTEQSLALYTKLGNIQEQAGVHVNLGNTLHDVGRWQEARHHYEAGAALAAEIGNTYDQALVSNNLGDLLRSLGDTSGAIEGYQVALNIWKELPFNTAVVAMNLGAAYIQQGNLDAAQEQLDRSQQLFADIGADGFLPELLRYQAELAFARDDHMNAFAICNESLEHAQHQGARLEEGCSHRLRGQILLRQHKDIDARASFEQSLSIFAEVGSAYEIARTQVRLADVIALGGALDGSHELLRQAVPVLRFLGAQQDLSLADSVANRHGLYVEV